MTLTPALHPPTLPPLPKPQNRMTLALGIALGMIGTQVLSAQQTPQKVALSALGEQRPDAI